MLNEKFKITEKLFLKNIGNYLKNFGFYFKGHTLGDEKNKMNEINFIFLNPDVNREIVFSYLPLDITGDVNECVCVFIHKKPNGSYTPLDILKHENIPFDSNKFFLLNYSGDFENQVQSFCDFIIDLFEKYLKDWITGKKWEEIPFDWGGYK